MIKNNRNNEQIYGRNDMIMLDQNNKIYGSLGLADKYVMRTEEGTRLVLNNPKQGRFGDVLTEFNICGRSSQFTTTGKNLADGQNAKYYLNNAVNLCGISNDDTGMSIDVSKLTNVTISTKSIQDRYRVGCVDTVPTKGVMVTCYNGIWKDGTKDSYTIDTTGHNYLIVNATKLEDIQVEKGTEATSYEPYTGGIPSPSPDYPQEIKSVVNPTVKVSSEDVLKVQSVTFPYTLNAIPVASSGNVTIDGQQWVCDEVDLERGVKVQRVKSVDISSLDKSFWVFRNDVGANVSATRYSNEAVMVDFRTRAPAMSNILPAGVGNVVNTFRLVATPTYLYQFNLDSSKFPTVKSWVEYLKANTVLIIYALATPIETPLTPAEIAAFSAFTTYYPVTIVENNYNTWMKATYKSMESV